MNLRVYDQGFDIINNGIVLISHSIDEPAFFIGRGIPEENFYRGNFKIYDKEFSRFELSEFKIEEDSSSVLLKLENSENCDLKIELLPDDKGFRLELLNSLLNRVWIRLQSDPKEAIWGGGEQFSHLNLRGHRFPMWSQEPGVGRDMTTRLGQICEIQGQGGGNDVKTYYPQPTYISSQRYALHLDSTVYSLFDFTSPMFHELEIWDSSFTIEIFSSDKLLDLVQILSQRFGYCAHLPEWIFNGAILGLKRGANANIEILKKTLDFDVDICAMWSEDWCGLRNTSFGARLFWDWAVNEERYPGLKEKIIELNNKGIQFLAYTNPNLCSDGPLFKEADEKNYLTKNENGEICLIDFGEFECGFVDFTNEDACTWFKDRIIKKNILDLGIRGWMADFGEYQPVDMKVHSKEDGWKSHNTWPVHWARINAEAIAEEGLTDDVLFFMRSGFTGSQKYCQLMWQGDQSVDFSRHDGLETAVCGALSCGLLGNTINHSDIGGYTTLHGNGRTEEVFMRWCEMAAFTPVMRTHESNRPDESFQFYQSDRALKHFSHMTKIYKHLVPYLKHFLQEAQSTGLPLQRPLFLHYENDRETWNIHDHYLYGSDLLVAPVHKSHVKMWNVYLPEDEWIHLWTDKEFYGGDYYKIQAPLGQPPVFYKKNSLWKNLFIELKDIAKSF